MHEALVLMRNLLQMCTYPFTSYFVKFLEQERLGIHLSWGSPYAFNQQIKCECMEINKDVYSQARTELEQIPTNPKSAKFSISSKVIDHILKPAKEIYCRYKKYAEESLCQQFIIHTWFQKEQKSPRGHPWEFMTNSFVHMFSMYCLQWKRVTQPVTSMLLRDGSKFDSQHCQSRDTTLGN